MAEMAGGPMDETGKKNPAGAYEQPMSPWKSSQARWAVLLGFAFGGFFDGILLHQILQWHHLLSLATPGDIRAQVLWDGLFHALMYAIAVLALWGLWRTHGASRLRASQLVGLLMLGFGVWHLVDAVVSHWLLGIHRIRVDSTSPLAWDLAWLFVFGLAPIGLGILLARREGPAPTAGIARLLLLTLATTGMAVWSLRPPPDQGFTTIVFARGVGPQQVMAALSELDARLVGGNMAAGVVVVSVSTERRWDFYTRGALLVSGSGLGGCLDWSTV